MHPIDGLHSSMKRRSRDLVVYTMHLELSEGGLEVWALRRRRKGRAECAEQVWQQGSWLRPQEKPASQGEAAMPVAGIAEGPKRDALPLQVASTPAGGGRHSIHYPRPSHMPWCHELKNEQVRQLRCSRPEKTTSPGARSCVREKLDGRSGCSSH